MPQRRPSSKLDVQIVTLIDFAGPMLPHEVARALGLIQMRNTDMTPEALVKSRIDILLSDGFLTLSRTKWAHYDTTHIFDPDKDRPAAPPDPSLEPRPWAPA